MIQDPAGQKGTVEPQLEARGDSTYRCSYQPSVEGVHTVHVTFAGVPIPRSPYTVTVGQGRPPQLPSAGHSSSWAVLEGWQPGRCCCSPALAPGASVLPLFGPPPPPPLAFSLSLSLHAFTFGRTRSSCLETCCSLLCPQGQRYLDLSSSGVGGGWDGWGDCWGSWCGWSTGEEACHVQAWAPGPWVMVPSGSFLHGPHHPGRPTGPVRWETREGVAPHQLPAAQPVLCSQLVTQVPAAPSAGVSSPRVCE